MNVPTEFLRGAMGLLAVACAYMAGRNMAGVRQGRQTPSGVYRWTIRTLLSLGALAFRHPVDSVQLAVWVMVVVAFTFAVFASPQQKARQEPPPPTLFPDEH